MGKEEAMATHADAVKTADDTLYTTGFADGVASVPPVIATPDVQSQIDAAVAAVHEALDPQIESLKASLSDDESKLADMTALETSLADKLEKVRQLIA